MFLLNVLINNLLILHLVMSFLLLELLRCYQKCTFLFWIINHEKNVQYIQEREVIEKFRRDKGLLHCFRSSRNESVNLVILEDVES